jgi:hypothetical protein
MKVRLMCCIPEAHALSELQKLARGS